MTLSDIARIRLMNHHISGIRIKSIQELVAWMGAMQAQDYAMVKWAIGLRIRGSTEMIVEEAINKGEIFRTHVMRPTWHLVSAEDIRWMIELTAPHVKKSMKSRHRELEITEAVLKKSNSLIIKALEGGNHLSREELIKLFNKNGISTGDNRASHLLLHAELDGIICSGVTKDRRPTYALLDERVTQARTLTRSEALYKLVQKYFSSHGPATLQDFIWWSGLPVADARNAIEMLKSDFIEERKGETTYWMPDSIPGSIPHELSVVLLPAYDEFIISYRDRSASLPGKSKGKAVSSNGIFRPVVLINGQVSGLWSRTFKNGKLRVELQFFKEPEQSARSLTESAVQSYRLFHSG